MKNRKPTKEILTASYIVNLMIGNATLRLQTNQNRSGLMTAQQQKYRTNQRFTSELDREAYEIACSLIDEGVSSIIDAEECALACQAGCDVNQSDVMRHFNAMRAQHNSLNGWF